MKRVFECVLYGAIGLGFFIVLGTFGMSDCDLLGIREALERAAIGLVMMGGGACGLLLC